MKKNIRLAALALLILAGFEAAENHGYAANSGILLESYMNGKQEKDAPVFTHYSQLKTIVLLPEGPFNQREAYGMIDRLGNIDYNILKRLNKERVKIKLFSGNLTDEPSASGLKGKKPRGYRDPKATWDNVPGMGGSRIVLAKIGSSEKGSGHGSINLELHELAHSVDLLGFDSIRTEPHYLKIWKEEAQLLFPGRQYFLSFPEEYFAETFAMYYLNSETKNELKAKAPKTYRYLAQLK